MLTATWERAPEAIERSIANAAPNAIHSIMFRTEAVDDKPVIQILVLIDRRKELTNLPEDFVDRVTSISQQEFSKEFGSYYPIVSFGRYE